MKYWDELTPQEREDYANQDFVGLDRRLIYLEPDVLSVCAANCDNQWEDLILNDRDWSMIEGANFTERQKYCFYNYVWLGRKQQEIADELGIPQQTISFHVRQAKKKVMTYLSKSKQKPFIRFKKECELNNGLFSNSQKY